MSEVPFIKMHGLGNDYVYIDCFRSSTASQMAQTNLAAMARQVSDRHRGVGSDGMVLILPDRETDACMRMFNADGTEAQMCGNAIRCVAKYLYESGLCHKERMQIRTLAGIRNLDLHIVKGYVEAVEVEMGRPMVKEDSLLLDGKTLPFVAVNIGNPHAVFFRETMPETSEILSLGERIGTHTYFPEGTNVEFVVVRNEAELDMRVWERGTGETMACGTGACAAAVAAMRTRKTQRAVTVHLLGGDLKIRWETDDSNVYMTGPATEVFRGEVTIDIS